MAAALARDALERRVDLGVHGVIAADADRPFADRRRSDSVRPVTKTFAPCRASSLATPRPMPRLPPVTTAT